MLPPSSLYNVPTPNKGSSFALLYDTHIVPGICHLEGDVSCKFRPLLDWAMLPSASRLRLQRAVWMSLAQISG